ncbi:MAG: putative toxin-antitoxin system toxin component, PIN family [Thermoanaerobaculia bacterium]|nr:putative toxin-antitoxin system toxin component, PIN family [Thermoanaerobaculia bacterium]
MKIVLDTNLLLVSISRRSETHRIFEALLDGTYDLCVSTEILLEYEEIIGREMGATFAAEVIDLLLDLPNTRRVERYFEWHLLGDADDNKFADCAVAVGADYLVSEDRDFRRLEQVPFPKIHLLRKDEFLGLLESLSTEK